MKKLILKISTLLSYLTMIFVNFLAVTLPLAGRNTGAISDSYPNLFAPAGYTFSIWGAIYVLLGIYVIYQLRRTKGNLVEKVSKIFIVNALLNATWIFTWHYDWIWLSVIVMLGLLFSLIKIADILRVSDLTQKEQWTVRLPFSVYFGWITVATIANITTFLVSIGWNGFGLPENFWTVAVLLVGALIGSWRMLRDRTVPYGLVLIWAYGGILSKHLSMNNFAGAYPIIIATVILCMVEFTGMILFILFKKNKIT